MYAGLISDLGETASRVFCDGEVSAAIDTVPSTVMLCAISPTFNEIFMFSVPFGASLIAVRRLDAKLGADASTVYRPAGSPETVNFPVLVRHDPTRRSRSLFPHRNISERNRPACNIRNSSGDCPGIRLGVKSGWDESNGGQTQRHKADA